MIHRRQRYGSTGCIERSTEYYNEIDRPHVVISLLTSTAKVQPVN